MSESYESDSDSQQSSEDKDNDITWVGVSIVKHFDGYGDCVGKVVDGYKEDGQIWYNIKYDDGDAETMTEEQVLDHLNMT